MDTIIFILTLFSLLGCGLVAGIFFAFSTFIMRALARILPAKGIEAMQSINTTVINPWFLSVFLGTALVCLLLALSTISRWDQPGVIYLLAGCLFYLIGTFFVTIIFNVPMNNALDSMVSSNSEAHHYWTNVYLIKWTFWNHVRTVAAIIGTVLLIFSLLRIG